MRRFAGGCASSKPQYNPFQVKKEDIRDRVKIVALASVRVGDDVPNGTEARQQFGGPVTLAEDYVALDFD